MFYFDRPIFHDNRQLKLNLSENFWAIAPEVTNHKCSTQLKWNSLPAQHFGELFEKFLENVSDLFWVFFRETTFNITFLLLLLRLLSQYQYPIIWKIQFFSGFLFQDINALNHLYKMFLKCLENYISILLKIFL